RVRIHYYPRSRLEPVGEGSLGLTLCRAKTGTEARVLRQWGQLAQLRQVGDPFIADCFGNESRQRRIGLLQPPPRSNTVGLVVEALREELGKIAQYARSEQVGVDGRHAIRAVRADDRQVGHPDTACPPLLDQADALSPGLITRIAAANIVQEPAVDLINDLQLPGDEGLEQIHRP